MEDIKNKIIEDMCLTMDHSYGMDTEQLNHPLIGYDAHKKESLRKQMEQLFNNCIKDHIVSPKYVEYEIQFKKKSNLDYKWQYCGTLDNRQKAIESVKSMNKMGNEFTYRLVKKSEEIIDP